VVRVARYFTRTQGGPRKTGRGGSSAGEEKSKKLESEAGEQQCIKIEMAVPLDKAPIAIRKRGTPPFRVPRCGQSKNIKEADGLTRNPEGGKMLAHQSGLPLTKKVIRRERKENRETPPFYPLVTRDITREKKKDVTNVDEGEEIQEKDFPSDRLQGEGNTQGGKKAVLLLIPSETARRRKEGEGQDEMCSAATSCGGFLAPKRKKKKGPEEQKRRSPYNRGPG